MAEPKKHVKYAFKMNKERFEEIQETITDLKEERSKAKGRIEDIETKWKEYYEISTTEEAKKLIDKLTKERDTLQQKEDALEIDIESLLETLGGE